MSIMSTMDENVIVMGAENRPHMLERSRYDSWQKSVHRREHWLISHMKKRYVEHVISLDVYTLLNLHNVAKEIWDIVKLLMEGSELSLQERESKLNIYFDRFTSEKRETIETYYLRFAKLINDITSSNPKNKATIHDGKVTVQNVQGRQTQSYGGNMAKGEVHIARQCTQAKRAQNSERFKDKMLLAQAQEVGVVMDEEQLAFLADNGEAAISGSPQARAVFMENLTPAGPIYDADTSPSYYSHIL
ncbi:hypothetical protein Tco_0545320 [Tanacetum coccineum]